MKTTRIDVFVFDRDHQPLVGAVIRFSVDGQPAGEVPNSDGRGSIELDGMAKTIDITVDYGESHQEKTITPDATRIEFVFDITNSQPPTPPQPAPPAQQALHPFSQKWFVETVQRIPALWWALGVAAIATIYGVAKASLGGPVDIPKAVAVVLGSAVLLVLFSAFAKYVYDHREEIGFEIKVLLWAFIISILLILSSLFFGVPIKSFQMGSNDSSQTMSRSRPAPKLNLSDTGKNIPEVGGSGSTTPYRRLCGSGEVLVGVHPEAVNSFLSRISVACGHVDVEPTQSGYEIRVRATSDLPPIGPQRDGIVGNWQRCPPDRVVTAVSVGKSRPGGWTIDLATTVTIFCARPEIVVSGSGFTVRALGRDALDPNAVSGDGPIACPNDGWVTGVVGRYGEYIDSVGFTCVTPSL